MPRLLTRTRPWTLVTALCLLFVAMVIQANGGDPLALVAMGTRFSEGIPNGTEGYDGQFNYYIARDPSNAVSFIDVPAYRFQRILLPGLGWLLSFGNAALIPWIFLITGVVSLAAGTALMERLLVEQHASRWYALAYGLTIGPFAAVRLSLPEPLAYALALGGLWLCLRERWLWSAALFALAALARETTLLMPLACSLYLISRRRWRTILLFGFITLIPFVLWQITLYVHLGRFGVASGGANTTGFEIIPFMGAARIFMMIPGSLIPVFAIWLLPFVIVPALWGLWRGLRDWQQKRADLFTALLFVHSAVMPFLPFSTYREPLGIFRFIIGLQIAVILYAAHRQQARPLRYSTLWIVTLMLLVNLIRPG